MTAVDWPKIEEHFIVVTHSRKRLLQETKFDTHEKQQRKSVVLYILIFAFLDRIWEDKKRFWTAQQQAFLEFNLLLVSSQMQF